MSRDYNATAEFRCHAGELRQVMVNLIGNALAAMRGGGRLQLRFRGTTDWMTGRPGVGITIADGGRGMSAAMRRKTFEPFYTTKDKPKRGWVVDLRRYRSRYMGRIAARSNDAPGRSGSVFRVFLPL